MTRFQVAERLNVDVRRGLSWREANDRMNFVGPNEFQVKEQDPLWKKYIEQFQNPLILLLLGEYYHYNRLSTLITGWPGKRCLVSCMYFLWRIYIYYKAQITQKFTWNMKIIIEKKISRFSNIQRHLLTINFNFIQNIIFSHERPGKLVVNKKVC